MKGKTSLFKKWLEKSKRNKLVTFSTVFLISTLIIAGSLGGYFATRSDEATSSNLQTIAPDDFITKKHLDDELAKKLNLADLNNQIKDAHSSLKTDAAFQQHLADALTTKFADYLQKSAFNTELKTAVQSLKTDSTFQTNLAEALTAEFTKYYSKTNIDSNFYTKTAVNTLLNSYLQKTNLTAETKAVITQLKTDSQFQTDIAEALRSTFDNYYTKPEVDSKLTAKADKTYTDLALALKTDQTYTDTELAKKADKTDLFEPAAVALELKSSLTPRLATKTEVNAKASKTYTDTELAKKADKTYTDTELAKKATTVALQDKLDKTSYDFAPLFGQYEFATDTNTNKKVPRLKEYGKLSQSKTRLAHYPREYSTLESNLISYGISYLKRANSKVLVQGHRKGWVKDPTPPTWGDNALTLNAVKGYDWSALINQGETKDISAQTVPKRFFKGDKLVIKFHIHLTNHGRNGLFLIFKYNGVNLKITDAKWWNRWQGSSGIDSEWARNTTKSDCNTVAVAQFNPLKYKYLEGTFVILFEDNIYIRMANGGVDNETDINHTMAQATLEYPTNYDDNVGIEFSGIEISETAWATGAPTSSGSSHKFDVGSRIILKESPFNKQLAAVTPGVEF